MGKLRKKENKKTEKHGNFKIFSQKIPLCINQNQMK